MTIKKYCVTPTIIFEPKNKILISCYWNWQEKIELNFSKLLLQLTPYGSKKKITCNKCLPRNFQLWGVSAALPLRSAHSNLRSAIPACTESGSSKLNKNK